jgi:hypothetical protein
VLSLCILVLLARDLPEGNGFVRGLVQKQRQQEELLNTYTYDLLEVEDEVDKKGGAKSEKTRLYEVFYVKGRPVRRLVAEEGIPLSPDRQAEQDKRVQDRVRHIEQKTLEETEFRLSQILERYDFRSIGREDVDGRPAVVLDFAARPGKRDLRHDNVLRSLAGRVWVDEAEQEIVRAQVRNTTGIKFALGIGASVSTVEFSVEFQKMDEAVWLPRRSSVLAEGHILLFKGFHTKTTETYSRYRRFEVQSEETVQPPSP